MVDGHTNSPRLAVCMAALGSKRESSREPHHAHNATVPVSGLLSRPRRWNVAHSSGALGRHTKRERSGSATVVHVAERSSERLAPAAYWVSWADAVAMISARNPEIASEVVRRLDADEHHPGCVAELRDASVDRKRFRWRPSWSQLREERPPQTCARDPGEWPHGSQHWASSAFDSSYRKVSFLSDCPADCQTHLRSHSGHNEGTVSDTAIPACAAAMSSTPGAGAATITGVLRTLQEPL